MDTLFERGVHGQRVPIIYKGRVVGHRVRYSNWCLWFLLGLRDPRFRC